MTDHSLQDYQETADLLYAIKGPLCGCDSYPELIAELGRQGITLPQIRATLHPVEADLHTHSTFSDGQLQPRRIVRLAKLMGLAAVAVTDHDSVSGVAEAVREGREIGIDVVCGVEFSTGRPGLEILAYFPHTERAVQFLHGEESAELRAYLKAIQDATHRRTLAIVPAVNEFVRENGARPEDDVAEPEIAEWYSGQEPFYPGTIAVLGLRRLSQERRDALGIHDPRVFNTKVVTPALKKLPPGGPEVSIYTVAGQVRAIREAGMRCITVLAHPIELTTKGKMSFDEAEALARELFNAGHIDGMEVNNARDTAETTARWVSLADAIGSRADRPFYSFSFSSDFHVLAPGVATGEITLGYGSLDERPGHRQGNLRPQTTWEELAGAMRYKP